MFKCNQVCGCLGLAKQSCCSQLVLLENDPRREITENISYIETRPGHADQVVQSPRFNGLKKKRVCYGWRNNSV